MLLKVHSASVLGIQAELIDIEVDLSVASKPSYHVVGLPDTAIKESGERVRAAIRGGADPGVRRPFIGFRIVLTPP